MDNIKIVNPFNDINLPTIQQDIQNSFSSTQGLTNINNMQTLSIGSGSRTMKVAQDGIWLGDQDPSKAPFSVAMDGTIKAIRMILTDATTGLAAVVLGSF